MSTPSSPRLGPVLICPSVVYPPAVPAIERTCATCGTAVWVSYAMAPVVDAGDAAPCCWRCVNAQVTAGADVVPVQHHRQRAAGMSSEAFDDMTVRVLAALRREGDRDVRKDPR